MELIVTITVLCISLTLLLAPCASSLHSDQLQASHELAHADHQLTLPTLPRKMKFNEMANMIKKDGEKGLNKHVEVLSGISHQKEAQVMHARTGTRQEWIQEGGDADASQFFTMDYTHVRRRRPIHNKSLPVAP